MAINKLRQSIRILLKEKRITLINITGLSISLACALFMLLWVQHELSYDRFHNDFEQLYRVEEDQYYSGEEPYHVNVTPYVSGPVWEEEVPEIEEQCRAAFMGGLLFTNGDSKFFENGIVSVDSSFFSMFTFDLKFGNFDGVLREPNTMVITEEVSTKYFGDENPVGKSILVNQEVPFTISAVIYDPPDNSILGFKVLFPWNYIEAQDRYSDSWGQNSIQTFVKLQKGSIDTVVNRKVTEVTNIYKENNTIDYSVASFSGIHLYSYFGFGKSPGAILYVYIFSAIALFVLIIACINFMNLSTARASIRAKEIGLRKVTGASRGQLVRQHLSESFLQTLISIILAFLLVLLLLNKFNQLAGKDVLPAALLSVQFLLGILGVLLITTFFAGIYPALFLSALKPIEAIREQSNQKKGSGLLRKVLVVFQFSLAVLLITGAMVASKQLNYMRNAELGFDKYNLVSIQLQGKLNMEYEKLRSEFKSSPDILYTTASMQPSYRVGSNSSGIDWDGKDPEQDVLVSFNGVHYDFIKTMDITLIGGRDFSEEYPGDLLTDTATNFIINQTLANIIGKDEIVGMSLSFMGLAGQVIGVMEDYHFKPLSSEIEPMALAPLPSSYLSTMEVRLSPENPTGGLDFMEKKWEELLPQYPFEYTYVDDAISDMYMAEERMSSLFRVFTIVAIVIACLGLFALASFTAQRRTKEIGIRKTMGALEQQIAGMMIRDFSLYILISLLIALPSVWFIARWWLNEFSYRINLGAGILIITALATFMVAVLTVLYHAIRISRTDPVKALWHE
ncbi:MAG: FtsX-like permease family protein [Bacteroidetes bacterium]|nr:FtsX-like permease family protein [Bacteroidota bacterium]